METWFIILISITISTLLSLLFAAKKPTQNLPPGPPTFPIIGNFLLPRKTAKLEPILINLHAKLGRIIPLHFGSRPSIFIANGSLAHQALIQNSAIFADRPPPHGQNTISTASYGATWRVLRRNLTSEILHPSQVKSYSPARNSILQSLLKRLKTKSESGDSFPVVEYFQYSMFSLLVLMSFCNKMEEKQIQEIKNAHGRLMMSVGRVNTLKIWPRVTKLVYRKQWEELFLARKHYKDVLIPLIREREKIKKDQDLNKDRYVLSYVDTLLDLKLPEENRKLNEDEIVNLCTEFLNGGTDTTSTTLQWIMANLIKYTHIQEKLFMEIKEVMKDEVVKEDDLQKMPYLKAVILEGLRRHPPVHLVIPHAVTEDVVLDGYLVPKNGTVNFLVSEIGRDVKVWEDPMAFRPERFLSNGGGEEFNITGSREIKMMPFGAGRRICPGYVLAMLHLEYFVANMVWCFEWKAVDGDDVDLEEKQEVLTVMKKPLQAVIYSRSK